MSPLEQQILDIQKRNMRVEADKAWEVSKTRRACVAGLTYVTACLFLWSIDVDLPYVHALVPTGGYVLSTLSLPWVKERWMRRRAG